LILHSFSIIHSQGHAKKLSHGLDVQSMNKSYGGAQSNICESIMKQHDWYFGMHSHTLEVGNTQSFTFSSTEDGPFWMDHAERESSTVMNDSFLPLRALLECKTKQFQNSRQSLRHWTSC
jgi:hypothetical protein